MVKASAMKMNKFMFYFSMISNEIMSISNMLNSKGIAKQFNISINRNIIYARTRTSHVSDSFQKFREAGIY